MNIKDKLINLMQQHFYWLNDDEDTPDGITNKISSQCETLDALGISKKELLGFIDVLKAEFDLEDIEVSEVDKWQRIKDVVTYIRGVKNETDNERKSFSATA